MVACLASYLGDRGGGRLRVDGSDVFYRSAVEGGPGLRGMLMSPVRNLLYQVCAGIRRGVKEALFIFAWHSMGHLKVEF